MTTWRRKTSPLRGYVVGTQVKWQRLDGLCERAQCFYIVQSTTDTVDDDVRVHLRGLAILLEHKREGAASRLEHVLAPRSGAVAS